MQNVGYQHISTAFKTYSSFRKSRQNTSSFPCYNKKYVSYRINCCLPPGNNYTPVTYFCFFNFPQVMPLLAGIANLLIIKITDYIRFLNASCQIGVNYHVDGRKQRVCQ